MSRNAHIEEYLQKVCLQIRWKKAHPLIRRELGDHLEDQAETFATGGMEPETATQEAVKTMGAPELVGSQLDGSYRPRPAWGIIATAAVIMAIGFFAQMYIVGHIEIHYVQPVSLSRSVFWLVAAVAALVIGYFVDYTVFARCATLLYLAFAGIMLITPIFFERLTYHTIYLYFLIPVVYAAVLWRYPYKGYGGLLGAYLLYMPMVLLGVEQSRPVAGIIYGSICILMLTICVLNGKFAVKKSLGLLIIYGPITAFAAWLAANSSLVERIRVLFYPELDPLGAGYAGVETQKILAGAKLLGTGSATPGASFLPDAVNSYMLTLFIHQFGWISLIVVSFLFGALLAFACVQISKQKSQLGKMVAGAITATFALQCALYVFNNIVNMFVGFTTLPLLSYGNTALVVNAFLVGLMLSVFRNDDVVCDSDLVPKRVPRFRIRIEPLQ